MSNSFEGFKNKKNLANLLARCNSKDWHYSLYVMPVPT